MRANNRNCLRRLISNNQERADMCSRLRMRLCVQKHAYRAWPISECSRGTHLSCTWTHLHKRIRINAPRVLASISVSAREMRYRAATMRRVRRVVLLLGVADIIRLNTLDWLGSRAGLDGGLLESEFVIGKYSRDTREITSRDDSLTYCYVCADCTDKFPGSRMYR